MPVKFAIPVSGHLELTILPGDAHSELERSYTD